MRDHGGGAGPARPPRPSRRWWRPQLAGLVGAVLALTLTVAACGGGGKANGVASLSGSGKATATTSAGGGKAGGVQVDRQKALAWARCMRQHGINLPDPQFSGDNIGQQLPSRAEQGSAKFKAAEQACKQYLPNGGQPTPADAQEFQQALAFARCMRQHGINLPDPKITADGIDQSPPARMDLDDPRLQAAEHACHQYGSLPPAKPGGPQRGGGGK
jgi:hypothetical protein